MSQKMTSSPKDLAEAIKEWAKGNDRAGSFSEEELVEIAKEAVARQQNQGGVFIHHFDDLVFERSITEGRNPFAKPN